MSAITFEVTRNFLGPEYTIGRIALNGNVICDTLEDTVRDYNKDGDLLDAGETKIFGKTAIPYGRYPVIITYSPKFKRKLPLLTGVLHFEGIRIHAGNHAGHTQGCILVGENTAKGMLTNSRRWEEILRAMIERYIAQGLDVFINIT